MRQLTRDNDIFSQLSRVVSNERLTPYLLATHEDRQGAIRLYEWNIRASGAVFELLNIVEVALRNALHRQLVSHFSGHPAWFDNPAVGLSERAQVDIGNAIHRLRRRKKDVHPSRVVAELPFGFWKFLLTKRYETTLWTTCLRHAFPGLQPQTRLVVFASVHELHVLRNRVAHHEPIFRRDLSADSEKLFSLLTWIDVTSAHWARSLSRVDVIWSQRIH